MIFIFHVFGPAPFNWKPRDTAHICPISYPPMLLRRCTVPYELRLEVNSKTSNKTRTKLFFIYVLDTYIDKEIDNGKGNVWVKTIGYHF